VSDIDARRAGREALYAACVDSERRACEHRATAAAKLEEGDAEGVTRASRLAAHFQARARLFLRCWESAVACAREYPTGVALSSPPARDVVKSHEKGPRSVATADGGQPGWEPRHDEHA